MAEETSDRAAGAGSPRRPAGLRISVLLVRPDGSATSLGSRPTDDRRLHTLANVCRASSLIRRNRARIGAGDRLRVHLVS